MLKLHSPVFETLYKYEHRERQDFKQALLPVSRQKRVDIDADADVDADDWPERQKNIRSRESPLRVMYSNIASCEEVIAIFFL